MSNSNFHDRHMPVGDTVPFITVRKDMQSPNPDGNVQVVFYDGHEEYLPLYAPTPLDESNSSTVSKQPRWNDGSEGIDSPILISGLPKNQELPHPDVKEQSVRDTIFLDILGFNEGDSPAQQLITGFSEVAQHARRAFPVWRKSSSTVIEGVSDGAKAFNSRLTPGMRRAGAIGMVGLSILGMSLRERAVADEEQSAAQSHMNIDKRIRTPNPILVSYTVPESSPRVLDLATAIDMSPEKVAKQVNEQLGTNFQPGDHLPAGNKLRIDALGTEFTLKGPETMADLVKRFNVPPNLWYAANPVMKTITYTQPISQHMDKVIVPRPVAIVEIDKPSELKEIANLPELKGATDGDPSILTELDDGFDGATVVLPADTVQMPTETGDTSTTTENTTTTIATTTSEVPPTSPPTTEAPKEPVIPQVAALNKALESVSILDQKIDVTNVIQAVKDLDAWFAPQDPDRRADLPAGYVKMLLPNEAEGVAALSVPASKTAGLERYVAPESEAGRRIFNEALRQFAALKYPEWANVIEDRIRDGNSPNHATHQGGQMIDMSTQKGGAVTDTSTGPVGDSMFSENYNPEFTADMLCFMAKLYKGDVRLVHKIISSDLKMVRRVNATVGFQFVLYDDDNEHLDHLHFIFNKAFRLPNWGLRARDLPWSTEQDLRIGAQAKPLSKEQFDGAHHAYQDWFASKLAKTAPSTTVPSTTIPPSTPPTTTSPTTQAPPTTAAPTLTPLPRDVLPKNEGIPPEIAALIVPSKYFSAIDFAAQIKNESHFNPRAVSDANAQGIAQFLPSTWKAVGRDDPEDPDTIASPFNVVEALDAQRRYMDGQRDAVNKLLAEGKIKGDPHDLTLAAYNAGINAVRRAGGIPNKRETREYIKRINLDSDRFARAVILEATNA